MTLPLEPNGRLLGILQVSTQTGNFLHAGIMVVGGRGRSGGSGSSETQSRTVVETLRGATGTTAQYSGSLVSIAGAADLSESCRLICLSAPPASCYLSLDAAPQHRGLISGGNFPHYPLTVDNFFFFFYTLNLLAIAIFPGECRITVSHAVA